MRSFILCALTAAGTVVAVNASALAQSTAPAVEPEAAPRSASPYGATYIPGVGYRYLAPGGARVYGYRAYGPQVYGYRRGYRKDRCFWPWDDCAWRRR